MKVLMVGPARSVKGGISAVVNNYYSAGLDKQVEIKYIETMKDGSKFQKLITAFLSFFEYYRALQEYPLVHIHLSSDKSLCRKIPFIILAKRKKKKLIIHQHGGNFEDFYYRVCGKKARKFIAGVLEKADFLLVVAPHLQEIFAKIVTPNKIKLFPNAIWVPEEVTHDYTEKKLLFLGRLCKEKGINELLDASVELKKEYPDLKLYLGGVWEEPGLKKKADLYADWIVQLGWIGEQEKQKYLRECNIFVLPTYFEGLPVSLLEGMAYGCACIATRVGSIPQIMENNKEGLLINPKSKEELMAVISYYFENPMEQEKMGAKAEEKIRAGYEIKASVEKLIRLYSEVFVSLV